MCKLGTDATVRKVLSNFWFCYMKFNCYAINIISIAMLLYEIEFFCCVQELDYSLLGGWFAV